MDNKTFKVNKKNAIISLIVIWCLIVLAVVVYFIFTIGKVSVEVKYAPFAAVVKLDDTVIMNNNSNYIAPGSYHLKVEYENFQTYEGEVTITEETKYLYGKLIPANEDGAIFMNEHNKDFLEIEGIAGKVATEEGIKQRENYPIINELPIKDPYYSIGYNIDEDDVLNITVEASISYRQLAVNKLLEIMSDEDFGKYNIVFYDLDNPFSNSFENNTESNPVNFIKKGFTNVNCDFEVSGTIDDDYYYGYLRYYYKDYINVINRIVLARDNETWNLAADPYPLLTTFNTPEVPLDIINKVNSL